MISLLRNKFQQKALFHIIHEDDIYLLNTEDAEWFQVLYYLPWEKYLGHAVEYYNALYEFNRKQSGEREGSGDEGEEEVESKVPFRLGGKKPKCFFGLLKSFIGATVVDYHKINLEIAV